jgi:hypothetical protein
VFERIACGWSLLASSWQVLRRKGSLPVFVSFFYAFWMLTRTPVFKQPVTGLPAMLTIVLAFLLCWGFVILFFYAALVQCALRSLRLGDASIWRGLCAALSRLPQLLGFLLISASGAFLFRSVWLVVPILMDGKPGPVNAFSRSRQLLRLDRMTTFWPGLLFILGPMLVFTVFSFFAWTGLITTSSSSGFYYGGICILAWIVVCWAIVGIYEAALYQYAVLGQIPAGFDGQALRSAFAGPPQNGGSWPS